MNSNEPTNPISGRFAKVDVKEFLAKSRETLDLLEKMAEETTGDFQEVIGRSLGFLQSLLDATHKNLERERVVPYRHPISHAETVIRLAKCLVGMVTFGQEGPPHLFAEILAAVYRFDKDVTAWATEQAMLRMQWEIQQQAMAQDQGQTQSPAQTDPASGPSPEQTQTTPEAEPPPVPSFFLPKDPVVH